MSATQIVRARNPKAIIRSRGMTAPVRNAVVVVTPPRRRTFSNSVEAHPALRHMLKVLYNALPEHERARLRGLRERFAALSGSEKEVLHSLLKKLIA